MSFFPRVLDVYYHEFESNTIHLVDMQPFFLQQNIVLPFILKGSDAFGVIKLPILTCQAQQYVSSLVPKGRYFVQSRAYCTFGTNGTITVQSTEVVL